MVFEYIRRIVKFLIPKDSGWEDEKIMREYCDKFHREMVLREKEVKRIIKEKYRHIKEPYLLESIIKKEMERLERESPEARKRDEVLREWLAEKRASRGNSGCYMDYDAPSYRQKKEKQGDLEVMVKAGLYVPVTVTDLRDGTKYSYGTDGRDHYARYNSHNNATISRDKDFVIIEPSFGGQKVILPKEHVKIEIKK